MLMAFSYVPTIIQAKVSLDRVNNFLHEVRSPTGTRYYSNDLGTLP